MIKYQFKINIPKKEYESFVTKHKFCNLLQSYDWSKIKLNWDSIHTGVYNHSELVATGLVLIKKLPLNFSMFYIPKGPILDYENKDLLAFYFDNLRKIAKAKHCVFIKFDPGIIIREFSLNEKNSEYNSKTYTILENLKSIRSIYKGFTTYIGETVQPRFHMGLYNCDLNQHFPKSTLRSIKKAQKKNVIIEEVGLQGLDEFSKIMHMTEERKHVHLRGKDYFELLLNTYSNNAHLFIAYVDPSIKKKELLERKKILERKISNQSNKKAENELLQIKEELNSINEVCEKYTGKTAIAGGIMIGYGKECEMLYAGSNEDFMNFRPQYLLYLTQFQYAFTHGYTFVTMGGVDGDFKDGLSEFKANFNPIVREYIGEFDLPIYKILYFLINKLLPILKKILQKHS